MSSHHGRPAVQEVLSALRALSTAIDRLDQVAADRYGLNRTDMRGLDVMGQTGPVAPTELARRLGFTTGGITTVIDRLERAGYARRVADPIDRRRLVIEATEAAARRDQEVFGGLMRMTTKALSTYSDAELSLIRSFLERTRDITAQHAKGLASDGGGPD